MEFQQGIVSTYTARKSKEIHMTGKTSLLSSEGALIRLSRTPRKFNEEGEEKRHFQMRRPGPSGSRGHRYLSVKRIAPIRIEQGKARHGAPVTR